jgi:hypothetical protein
MACGFDERLADELKAFNQQVRSNKGTVQEFSDSPTKTVKAFLTQRGFEVPDPETFHAHVIKAGDSLPDEPLRATVERSIYVFRKSGLFEYKSVPGSPGADDDFMYNPTGACACCNCCVLEI